MTREESLEALCVTFEKLDEDEQRGMIRLIEQMKRAHTFGLDVRFDEHTFTFFIADAATNTVVAPAADEYSHRGSMAGRLREERPKE